MAGAAAGFSEAQAERARQLLDDGGLVAPRRPGVYRTAATSGNESYLVAATGV